jgi:HAMP domain-containing protein
MLPVTNSLLLIVAGLAIVAAVALGLAIWLAIRLRRLERHYQALTAGTDGGSLEAVLEDHVGQVQQATRRVQELDTLVMRLERNNRTHLQRVGFLRFNPFRDTGGDQSFALALADEGGSGVVISSLHSREVTRVYAKPLVAWQTSYQLTDEEREAIKRAKGD